MDNQFVNSHRTRLTHNTFWSLSLYGISCDVHYHIGSPPWIQTLYQIALLFSAACDNLSAIIPSQILAHRIQKAYWMICGRIFCFPKPNVAASIFKNILLSRHFCMVCINTSGLVCSVYLQFPAFPYRFSYIVLGNSPSVMCLSHWFHHYWTACLRCLPPPYFTTTLQAVP